VSPIRNNHEVVAPPTPLASVEPTTPTGIAATGSAGVESVSDAAGEVEPEAPSAVTAMERVEAATVEPFPVAEVIEADAVVDAASTPVMRAHPAADLFPLLPDDQLAELAQDIRVRGLVEPIVTVDVSGVTMILDGRNRYRACLVAGVEPRTIAWDGTGGSPSGFVLAKNIHRRHLSPSQRAAIAVDLLPMLEAEARERQVAAAEATNARAHLALVEAVPEASSEPVVRGRSRDIAASALGVSGRSVGDAKAIAEAAPEVLVEVKAGNLSIPEGRRIAALPTPEARTKAIKDVKAGTGRKERVPKTVVAPPSVTDTLGPVRAAVGSLGKLLDGIPKTERPIWWAPLRKAIRVVAAK
jgi:ParB-like chromosome segregation protein Spo0J